MSTYIESVNVKWQALPKERAIAAGRIRGMIKVPGLVFMQVEGRSVCP